MMEILRRILERVRQAAFVVVGGFSVLVFLAAQTGAPPAGTVMEDCTVFGIENYGHPVELNADQCDKMLEKQKRRYGTAVPPVQRPEWAQLILGIAELPLKLFK